MKRFLITAALAAATFTAPALAADVGVSISVGQPGFYGRLDIGDYGYSQPQVIYRQPVVVQRVEVDRPPVYLRVPRSHRKNWKKHCRQYNACGERVLFVQNNWYNRDYAPHYRDYHERHRGGGNDRGGDRNDNGRGDHGNQGNNHQGNGHDKGHKGKH
ncbi:MAG: hypothetical protein WAO76_06610 [Georgfuchsia sp.]